jgi:NitT/TauT family transport system substrate-binding protein
MGETQRHLERTLAGDKRAYGEVVSAYREMAMGLARRRLRREALAEEAVQEAFLAAYLNLASLRSTAAFGPWLRTILEHCCSRIRRKEQSGRTQTIQDDVPDSETRDPYAVYTRHLDQAKVRSVLESLSGDAREVCVLRYIHGLSYREIAGTLDSPMGTVKRRLHEAKNRIVTEFNRREQRCVRLGFMPVSDHLLAMIAHHHHDQKAFGLQVRRFLSWARLVRSLEDAELDAAFVMAPLAMALRNKGLPIMYVLDGHHEGSALTVNPGAGETLPGSGCMALPHAASTHRLLLHAMYGPGDGSRQGPKPRRPDTRVVNPSYVIGSMRRREIEGFFCAEPWSTQSMVQGVGRVLARSRDLAPGHICCILVVREEFARKHRDLLQRLLHSLRQAGEFAASHPRRSAAIQARYTGVPRDLAEHILVNGHVGYQDLAPDMARAEYIHELALESGVLEQPCDLDAFVCPDFC